mgnify:CR=1 FL=1
MYVVKNGRKKGIFYSWSECQSQVSGFKGAVFKKVENQKQADDFLGTTRKITDFFTLEDPSKEVTGHKNTIQSSSSSKMVEESVIDNTNMIEVYTDGSCLGNGRKGARAGIGIYFGDDDSRNVSEPFLNKPTNQRAELNALLRAIQIIEADINNSNRSVIIYTDSKYSIDCIYRYSKGWIRNGWKTANGNPVKNQDLLRPLLGLMRPGIQLIHVKAHTGRQDRHSKGNEMADRFAVQGSQM